jgi:hypothetical protein
MAFIGGFVVGIIMCICALLVVKGLKETNF